MRWFLVAALSLGCADTNSDGLPSREPGEPIVCSDFSDRTNYADEHDCPEGYELLDDVVCVDESGGHVGWHIAERGDVTHYNYGVLSFTCEAGHEYARRVVDDGDLTYFNGHTGAVTDHP